MKTKILLILAIGGLAFLFTSCEKEEDMGVGGTTGGGTVHTDIILKNDTLIYQNDKIDRINSIN